MTPEEANAWRPGLPGWSTDILQWQTEVVGELPAGPVCVELGVWCGRSLLHLAERRPDAHIYGIDSWQELDYLKRITGDVAPYTYALARMIQHAPDLLGRVSLLRYDSVIAASLFSWQSVDYLFIDSAHDYATTALELAVWRPSLRSGAILAGHDYSDSFPGVRQAVDEFAKKHGLRVENTIGSVWQLRRQGGA